VAPTIDFETTRSDDLIADASRELARHSLKRYLRPMYYVAMAINFFAFILALVFFPYRFLAWFLGFLAIAPPLYWIAALNFRPRLIRAILRRYNQPSAHISLGSEAFTVAAKGRVLTLPWTDVREVLEYRTCFLFVIARFVAVVVPKEGLPTGGSDLLRTLVKRIKPRTLTETLFP
jgi:YcxB-like protein